MNKIFNIRNIGIFVPLLSASVSYGQVKPNVVLIYADDIGIGDLSCYGTASVQTPNVDRLAKQGVRFTNVHSSASTCTPSRYSLITGEYAFRKNNTGIAAGDACMIVDPERFSLADVFKSSGYSTGIVGKWHLGLGSQTGKQDWNGFITPSTTDLGFDYSYIMAATLDRVPCVFIENGKVVNLDPADPISVSYKGPFPGEPTGKNNPELLTKLKPSYGHSDAIVNGTSRIGFMKGGKSALWIDENFADTITQKAVKFIRENKDHPFFLYFATGDVHVPRMPHPRFVGKSGMGARGDALLSFDESVGKILDVLKQYKLDKNTIIILSSDNGPVLDDGYQDQAAELLGQHRPWGHFRGAKGSLFEAGTRVPCIITWGNKLKPHTSDALLGQVDWLASFAGFLHANLPQGSAPDSENHLNAWFGKSTKGRKYLVSQNNAGKVLALETDEWKYIEPGKGPQWQKETSTETGLLDAPQLYNLKKDKGEKINVASEYPSVLSQMKQKLEEIRTISIKK